MNDNIPPTNNVTDTAPPPAAAIPPAANQPAAGQQDAGQPDATSAASVTGQSEVPDNRPREQAAGTEPVPQHAQPAPGSSPHEAAAVAGGSETAGPEAHTRAAEPSPRDEQSIPPQPHREQPEVRRRRATFLPDHAAVLDMLRRVMVATMQGSLAREDAREIRATAEVYLKHLGTSSKTEKSRASVDLAGLRQMAMDQPLLMHILEPLLSDDELAQLVVGPTSSVAG